MKYLEGKAIGFYGSILGAVLALIGLCMYRNESNALVKVTGLLAAVLILQLAVCILMAFVKKPALWNLLPVVNGVLVAAALVSSFRNQVDALGYVVSGLYEFHTVQNFVTAAALMLAAMILYIISSYPGMEK